MPAIYCILTSVSDQRKREQQSCSDPRLRFTSQVNKNRDMAAVHDNYDRWQTRSIIIKRDQVVVVPSVRDAMRNLNAKGQSEFATSSGLFGSIHSKGNLDFQNSGISNFEQGATVMIPRTTGLQEYRRIIEFQKPLNCQNDSHAGCSRADF